ncbi:hypothetical protein AB0N07_25540 [Streptomyces sp. NPDC051172]|uniref:hypothetical protein n=1 Tax=Streptomyces sp. NPDC051172 TaxID=3155796 RepID=UPI00343C059B
MPATHITDLLGTIDRLERCLHALRQRTGESAVVQNLLDTAARLRTDAAELGTPPVPPPGQWPVAVAETPYDPLLWHDAGADDEGVGGHRPAPWRP